MTEIQKRSGLFCLMAAVLIVAWWPTVQHLFDVVWNVDTYSHALIVPFASAWLVWRNFEDDQRMGAPSVWGAAALVPITVLWMMGRAMEAAIVQHLALLLGVQAVFLACFGWQATKRNFFPLAFLFLVIPFGGGLVIPLQRVTADMVVSLLSATGVSFKADGELIQLSNGLYEIAEACAGLKFLFTSAVTGILLCYLAFESWWRRVAMLLASVLVPVFANIIRVYTTLLIAEATDQDFAKSIDHVVYGWVFLSIVLFILIAIAYRFSDKHDELPVRPEPQPPVASARIWHSLIILPALAAIWMHAPLPKQQQCSVEEEAAPLCEGCGYRLLPSTHAQLAYGFEGADADKSFMYRHGAERFSVVAGLFAPDRQNHRVVQPIYRGLGEGWFVLSGAVVSDQEVDGIHFEEMIIWRGEERALLWRTHYVGGTFADSGWDAKMKLGLARLSGESPVAAALVLVSDMNEEIESSRASMRKFLSTFPPERFLWSELTTAKGETVCAE